MSMCDHKQFVAKRFSRSAKRYAGLADIQTAIARQLALKCPFVKGMRVLDVGAGEGVLGRALADKGIEFVALDAAWGMIKAGKAQSAACVWVQADGAALPFLSKSFDGVISASAYQWVDDLPAAFRATRRVLKPGGHFKAAMFGAGSLGEFLKSLQRAGEGLKKDVPALKRLPDVSAVRAAMKQAGFRSFSISVKKHIVHFDDVKALLTWLKGIGANALAKRFFWGKALLAGTEGEYRRSFADAEGLRVTFEVIWIEGRS